MIVITKQKLFMDKLKKDLCGCHIIDKCVYFRYSIFNCFLKPDFRWDYGYQEVYYFCTDNENTANLLNKMFPEIEIRVN